MSALSPDLINRDLLLAVRNALAFNTKEKKYPNTVTIHTRYDECGTVNKLSDRERDQQLVLDSKERRRRKNDDNNDVGENRDPADCHIKFIAEQC
uniref:Uncharacterized protein n=1 Tax=Plectus sambesii TaxID=2011161 RepID=A0A914WPW0_9BILA